MTGCTLCKFAMQLAPHSMFLYGNHFGTLTPVFLNLLQLTQYTLQRRPWYLSRLLFTLWLLLSTWFCYHRKTHYALTIKLTTSNDVMVIVMGLNHRLSMFIYSYHIETHYLVLTYSVGLSPATVVMCFNMRTHVGRNRTCVCLSRRLSYH